MYMIYYRYMKLFFLIVFNLLALGIADLLVPGFHLTIEEDLGNPQLWLSLFIAGFLLLLVNKALKPILEVLLFPLIFLSLGIVSFLINIGLLHLYGLIIPEVTIDNFIALVLGSLVISLVNTLTDS